MAVLYSPNGKTSIDAHIDQVEFLKSKGWTEEKSKSISKKNKNSEE
jgi:hypothetical protein